MTDIIDTAIVGGGVAGLAAGLFLGRATRSVIVFDAGKARIHAVEEVREYLGFDAASPSEVLALARKEVLRYGVEIRPERVATVTPRPDGLFDVAGERGTVTVRSVVLATGLVDELPPLTGLPKAWGRDVRVCPCFDGYEVRKGQHVVFGLGKRLAHMASWVSMWSPNVAVVSHHAFDDADTERLRLLGIPIIRDDVTGLVHEGDKLIAVTTAAGQRLNCDATWIAMRSRAASDLAATMCEVDADGFAKTDSAGRTTRPGLFAIGNADEPWAHLAHAAASGTTVGPIVTMYLLERKLEHLREEEAARVAA